MKSEYCLRSATKSSSSANPDSCESTFWPSQSLVTIRTAGTIASLTYSWGHDSGGACPAEVRDDLAVRVLKANWASPVSGGGVRPLGFERGRGARRPNALGQRRWKA